MMGTQSVAPLSLKVVVSFIPQTSCLFMLIRNKKNRFFGTICSLN